MEKYTDLLNKIEAMSVLELNELVKVIEEKFGVSAAAVAAAPAAGGATAEAEEKSTYTVHLKSVGEGKIAVMKVVKESLGIGLKDAKDLVDAAPCDLQKDVKKVEAEALQKALSEAGATVELK